MLILFLVTAAIHFNHIQGFNLLHTPSRTFLTTTTTTLLPHAYRPLHMNSNNNNNLTPQSFKDLSLQQAKKTLIAASLLSFLPLSLSPTKVNAASVEDVNTVLAGYGIPPVLFTPPGFSNLVSEFGRGNIKEKIQNPIVVQFAYPNNWVVQKTSVNNNGEAGTISANDYIKGDSAFLFVSPSTAKLSEGGKELVRSFILKSLSQKGDPVDSLSILKISEGAIADDGSKYLIVDFKYELNTEAGFLISRQAVASLTSVGDGFIQGLIAATTSKRWKNGMESKIRDIVQTFRVHKLNSGIFATDK